jgi:hypothetical protein
MISVAGCGVACAGLNFVISCLEETHYFTNLFIAHSFAIKKCRDSGRKWCAVMEAVQVPGPGLRSLQYVKHIAPLVGDKAALACSTLRIRPARRIAAISASPMSATQ